MPLNRLALTEEAEEDLDRAYAWYEDRRPGLGEDFLSAVDAAIQFILRQPTIFAKVHDDYRRVLVRRFPYAIFYEFDRKTVTIFCVFHTAQNPEKWRMRLS